jgi:hypothetical protein
MKVNEEAVRYAKRLIESGKVDVNSKWSNPSAIAEDTCIEKSGWDEYGKWFLAVNPDKPEREKQHYEFPYGDFTQVFREGLIAAKRRAAEYRYPEIGKVADQLLQLIEQRKK